MGVKQTKAPLEWYNNLKIVSLLVNPILHSLTKQMKLLEEVIEKKLQVYHVPSLDPMADILTKALLASHFHRIKGKLNVV